MSIRGNTVNAWILRPDGDATWTADDWERARTLEARFIHLGLTEAERAKFIPCAVWKAKLPGLQYSDVVEVKLRAILNTA